MDSDFIKTLYADRVILYAIHLNKKTPSVGYVMYDHTTHRFYAEIYVEPEGYGNIPVKKISKLNLGNVLKEVDDHFNDEVFLSADLRATFSNTKNNNEINQ